MSAPPKYVLDAVVKSLREHPDEWTIDYYTAENKRLKMRIWVENRYYGTELKIMSMKWGGQGVGGGWFGSWQPWRWKLCREVDKIAEQRFKAQLAVGDGCAR